MRNKVSYNLELKKYYFYIPTILIFIVGLILSIYRWASEDEVIYLKETMIMSEFLKMGRWFGNEDVGLHGFLFKLPVAIVYLVTGPNVFIADIFHVLLASISSYLTFKICNCFFKNNLFSFLANILTVFSYYYLSVLNTYLRDIPVMFALLLFIYALIKEKPYWILGLLFLLVLDAKEYIAVILTPVLLLWLPIIEYNRKKISFKFFTNTFLKFFQIFSPSIIFLYLMFFTPIIPVNSFTADFLNLTAKSVVSTVNNQYQISQFGTDTSKIFSTIENNDNTEIYNKEFNNIDVKAFEPVKKSLELRKLQPKRTITVKGNDKKSDVLAANTKNSKQENNNVKFYGRSEGRNQEVAEKKNLESRKVESIKKPENKLITENRKTETRKESGIRNLELGRKEEQIAKTEKEKQLQSEKKRLEEQKVTGKTNEESRQSLITKKEEQKQTIRKKEEQLSKTEKEKQVQTEMKRLEEQKVTGKTNEESQQSLITKKEEQKPTIRRKGEKLAITEKEKQVQAEKKRLEEQKPVTEKKNIENRITETKKETGIGKQELGKKEEQLAKTEKEKQLQAEKKRLEEQKVTGKTNEESRQSLITEKEEQKPVIRRKEEQLAKTEEDKQVQAEKKRLEEQKPVSAKQNTESRVAETKKESGIGKQELGKKEEQLAKTEKEKQLQSEKKRLEEQKVTGKTNEESRQSLITKKEEQKPVIRRKEEQLAKTEKEKQLQAEKKRIEEQKPVVEKQNTENRIAETKKESVTERKNLESRKVESSKKEDIKQNPDHTKAENRIAETKKESGIGKQELGRKEEQLSKTEKEKLDEPKNVIKKKEEQTEEKIRSTIQNNNKEKNFEEDNNLALIDSITGKKIGNISEEDVENLKEEQFFKIKQSSDSLTRERSKFINKLESIGITILNILIVYGQKLLSPRTFSYMSFPLYLIVFSLFACFSILKKNYKRPDFLFVSIYLIIYLAVYLIRPSHARYLLHIVPILSLYVIYFFIQGLDSYKKLLIPVLITLPLTAATLYFEITMPLVKLLAHLFFYSLLFFIIYLLYKNRKEMAKKISIAFILLLSFFTFGSSIMFSYNKGQIRKYIEFGYNNEYSVISKEFDKKKNYFTNLRSVNACFIQFYNKDINQGIEYYRFEREYSLVLKDWVPKSKMESKYNYIPNFYFNGGIGNRFFFEENNIDYFVLFKSLKMDVHVFPYLYSKEKYYQYYEEPMKSIPEWFEFERKISLKNKVLYFYRIKYEE